MMSASRPDAGSAVVTLDAGEQKETIRSAEATVSVDAPAIVRQPRPPTIRSMLVWTAIVWVIPPWICIVAAILLFYQHERAHIAESTASIAQVLMGTVDRYLAGKTAALQILAISPYLKSGDLAGFHREASEIAQQLFETNIVLTEPSGRQVVNTLVSYGEPLPLHGASPQQGQVLATGRPVVSDVFFGPVMKKQVMAAAVPVFGGDEVAYVLAAGILPERLRELLVHQGLQPDWVVSIFDTSGVIAARTHDFERLSAKRDRRPCWQRCRVRPPASWTRPRSKVFQSSRRSRGRRSRIGPWRSASRSPSCMANCGGTFS
jgi:hypothetical protein